MLSQQHKKTSIGGQALIEGIMMRGPETSSMAVRQPDGEINLSTWSTNKGDKKPWYKTAPIVRGSFNFIDMMALGYKCLIKSADLAGFEEEEPSKFEKKLMELLGDKFSSVLGSAAMLLGVALSVGLFMVLPTVLVGFLKNFVASQAALTAIEAVTKIAIFVLYLYAVSKMGDVRRVFEYHGAEHKTIACYEAGEELTVENVRKHSRFHPRCGTSFMLIVMVVSVLVFSFASWSSVIGRVLLKLLLLPLVVGISFEIIKLAGRYDNPLTRAISAPGLWLQNLTTYEPHDEQIEVAIAAMKPCIPVDQQQDRW